MRDALAKRTCDPKDSLFSCGLAHGTKSACPLHHNQQLQLAQTCKALRDWAQSPHNHRYASLHKLKSSCHINLREGHRWFPFSTNGETWYRRWAPPDELFLKDGATSTLDISLPTDASVCAFSKVSPQILPDIS